VLNRFRALPSLPRRVPRRGRDQRGFTIMETLVAMLTGIIVTGALFAILEVSLHQSTRLSDVAQATQLGRTAMTHIVDELHSACIASSEKYAPVQKESSATKLVFSTAYSEAAEITSARKDEIVWSEAKGTLTDNVYKSSGGSWPSFTFPSTPTSTVRIGEHISKAPIEIEGEKAPIFKYYKYATKPATSPSAPSMTLTSFPVPASPGYFSSTEAAEVSSVAISFKAAPNDAKTELGQGATMTSQVTFAFEAPSSEAPIVATPCE
jgi:type II secretory pathway pseudopilin PulG